MHDSLSRLLPSDDNLNHQVVETFATVQQSDHAWTEKIWACFSRKDGSLQVDLGLGKYHNRNVMDAFAGVSRGVEQWTVRASRELWPDPETTAVGAIHFEVLEPMRKLRYRLEENDIQPIAFDITFEQLLPPFLERRDRQTEPDGLRTRVDLLRYHQSGKARGWVRLDGQRIEVDEDGWFAFRDHSWGIRGNVGAPLRDVKPRSLAGGTPTYLCWTAMQLLRRDGGLYEFQHHMQSAAGQVPYHSAFVNHADGRQEEALRVLHDLKVDPINRRVRSGTLTLEMEDGSRRTLEIEALSKTGFHLGTGLYVELEGQMHGMWRGAFHTDGEHFSDCGDPAVARRIHQIRDCVLRVREGEAEGWGIFESIIGGAWPEWGLDAESAFI